MSALSAHGRWPMSSPQTLQVHRGVRSEQPIIVAVDFTVLGPALGGCRITTYPSWRDSVADAARLAAAMTEKAALAGLDHGGGKTVVALDPATAAEFSGPRRRDLLHDIGDVVQSFDGRYWTGPDVGSSPRDMAVIGERTPYVLCRPEGAGGSGDSSEPTAAGVIACIDAVRQHVLGRPLFETSAAVVGLGNVGLLVARHLARAGAQLVVSDIDASRRQLVEDRGAQWLDPDEALLADVDILVPAALGGVLTARTVPRLRCSAIVGPANNQLDDDSSAGLLHARGIIWAPDTVVSAGGIVAATARELRHLSVADTDALLAGIGARLASILTQARQRDVSPLHVAREHAHSRLSQYPTPTA